MLRCLQLCPGTFPHLPPLTIPSSLSKTSSSHFQLHPRPKLSTRLSTEVSVWISKKHSQRKMVKTYLCLPSRTCLSLECHPSPDNNITVHPNTFRSFLSCSTSLIHINLPTLLSSDNQWPPRELTLCVAISLVGNSSGFQTPPLLPLLSWSIISSQVRPGCCLVQIFHGPYILSPGHVVFTAF